MKNCSAIAIVALSTGMTVSSYAGIITETTDAGDLPGTALTPSGSGLLTHIVGVTNGAADAVDMYKIFISDPVNFMASTVTGDGGAGAFDTMLWLFDVNGIGVAADDDSGFSVLSKITFGGTTGLTAPPAGVYYLAISGFKQSPVSQSGSIFGANINNSGPDGGGGLDPINGWVLFGNNTGSYDIALSGASFVPTPGAMSIFGAAGLLALRRRRS